MATREIRVGRMRETCLGSYRREACMIHGIDGRDEATRSRKQAWIQFLNCAQVAILPKGEWVV